VIYNGQIFDTINSQVAFSISSKIWYKDSLSIQEVPQTNFTEDEKGHKTREDFISHYVFIDPRTKSFYYYKNFSDTAKIIKKYSGTDSFFVHGGWNFYADKNIVDGGWPVPLSDTVINQVSYKRVKFKRSFGQKEFNSIGYFRCDKKGTLFKMDKSYSEKLGCPMVKIDNFLPGRGQLAISNEVDFLADTLSAKELKVFDAWEKNARENIIK
jgi:hypothetical protein